MRHLAKNKGGVTRRASCLTRLPLRGCKAHRTFFGSGVPRRSLYTLCARRGQVLGSGRSRANGKGAGSISNSTSEHDDGHDCCLIRNRSSSGTSGAPDAPNRLLPTSGAWSAQVAVSAQKHHQQEECLSVLPLARGCLVRILEASRFQAPHEC